MEVNSTIQIQVDESLSGSRIDKALASIDKIDSRTRANHLIDAGNVLVNGKTVKSSYVLKSGDLVIVTLIEVTQSNQVIPKNIDIDILYQDSDLAVINKPAGLVVHPAAGHTDDTLVNALAYHISDLNMKFGDLRPGIVHRLDKDTSGILVVAKNDITQLKLQEQFKNRTVERYYYAVIEARVKKNSDTVISHLARHSTDRKKYASLRDEKGNILRDKSVSLDKGKVAITNYSLINTYANELSFVKLKLETGRTHQIRVHMSELGYPLLADPIYGKKKSKYKAPRLALHAASLAFEHPHSKERLSFEVPWPEDYQVLLKKWGFINAKP